MTKTENYQLNQWDPEDRVTHTDFNADNAKLDAALVGKADLSALNALQDSLTTLQAAFETLQAKALTSPRQAYTTGMYTGTGTTTDIVYLTFTPWVLIVTTVDGYTVNGTSHMGGIVVQGRPNTAAGISIVTNGFQVGYGGTGSTIQSNIRDQVYHFIAFK